MITSINIPQGKGMAVMFEGLTRKGMTLAGLALAFDAKEKGYSVYSNPTVRLLAYNYKFSTRQEVANADNNI